MVHHVLRRIPVGIAQTGSRRERDSHGSTDVPADRYWGACTQRALKAFPTSVDRIPDRFYWCYGYAKQAAAMANEASVLLQPWKREAITVAVAELIEGKLADHFPLAIGQSGSGREIDCNVNEVLANRSIQLLGGVIGSRSPIHPAKDVNLAQTAANTFTTAMHIAIVSEIEQFLVPNVSALAGAIERNAEAGPHSALSKSGYAYRLRQSLRRIDEAEGDMHDIVVAEPLGVVAPGRSQQHVEDFAKAVAAATRRPFIVAGNTQPEACSLDPVIATMAAVRGLASTLRGITEEVSLATSAPDPLMGTSAAAEAPGVSAVARPVGLEASVMACVRVIAEDARVVAGSSGCGAARAMRPMIARSVLSSIGMLGDLCETMRAVFAGQTRGARGRADGARQ